MKKKILFYLLIIALIQTSCRSIKDIKMFQELSVQKPFYEPDKPVEHKIKPFDNLYINIQTLDPEVNQLFNPSSSGGGLYSGTYQLYGSPSSMYINGYQVKPDSTVQIPIIGKMNFVGLSLEQAQEKLKQKAEIYLKDPNVQVKLLNYRVNVLGEVRAPGMYYNYEGNLSIFDAISMANGISDYSDLRHVLVKRQEDGKVYTYNVNLTDNSIFYSDTYYLKPNDIIYIPPSKLKRRGENSASYSRFLSTISTFVVVAAFFLSR